MNDLFRKLPAPSTAIFIPTLILKTGICIKVDDKSSTSHIFLSLHSEILNFSLFSCSEGFPCILSSLYDGL
jgi:hypothetical protein